MMGEVVSSAAGVMAAFGLAGTSPAAARSGPQPPFRDSTMISLVIG